MRKTTLLLPLVVPAAAAVVASAAPGVTTQVTSSAEDSRFERLAVVGPGRWASIRSNGDLTPGAPGNGDLSDEVWRLDLLTGELIQATNQGGGVNTVRVTIDGNLILASQGDLTPGAPGNPDGSFESWYFDAADGTIRQLTASAEDSFFQTARERPLRAFYSSKGDLVPGGNADASYEVFSVLAATGEITQVTSSAGTSLLRGLCGAGEDLGIVESESDLTPGEPGNEDGSREVYLVDFRTGAFTQLTASAEDSYFAGTNSDGRFLAIESRGDLTPVAGGNADGSQEVFVWSLHPGRLVQVTSSAGDSEFAGFVPRSRLLAIHSRGDLVAGGNTDGSQEVFVVDLRSERLRQLTVSSGDSTLLDVGNSPARWAVIRSTGDLRPDVPGGGTGTPDLYVQRIRNVPTRAVRLSSGDAGAGFAGFGPRSGRIAIDTTTDLVPGSNADGSREVFLVTVGPRRPVPRQITSSAADSTAAAISPGYPVVAIDSRADLVAGGNPDGSREVFLHRYGRLPRRGR